MNRLLTALLALALSSFCATAAIIRVPADQPTIQAGIEVAVDGDTVLLADRTYRGEGNRDIHFDGKAITLRSENGPQNCILDAQGSLEEEPSCFHIQNQETWSTVIIGLTITGGYRPGILIEDASPAIQDCVVTDNTVGIRLAYESSALVEKTWVHNNGVGIQINGYYSSIHNEPLIIDSGIGSNRAHGISCSRTSARIINCMITSNYSSDDGGGIYCNYYSEPIIRNCTIVDNFAGEFGGGVCSEYYAAPMLENCIIAENRAGTGDQYAVIKSSGGYAGDLTISYSNVRGETYREPGCGLEIGPGVIHEIPIFTSGPLGARYLSQTAAGQATDCPCVDAGNPASELILGTTRTDSVQDSGVIDLGYHYPDPDAAPLPETLILSGPANNEDIQSPVAVFTFSGTDWQHPASALTYSWRFNDESWSDWSPRTWAAISDLESSTEPITFEVRARDPEGDVDSIPPTREFFYTDWTSNWRLDRIVVGPGPGPGNPPLVRTGQGQWTAYSVMRYGANVAAGDIDGNGTDEVITGPGPGTIFGPHVRCFRPDGTPVHGSDVLAYGTHKYGVNVAAGDVDGDGYDEIITGAGPGPVFGPHVRGWNHDGGKETVPIPGISFMAYGTNRNGVNVTCGDIDGDGIDEIITGAGPSAVFGPHVRGWRFDGSQITSMSDVSYFAFNTPRWGVNVACGDLDGDGIDEIITGTGPGPEFSGQVRAWDYGSGGIAQMPGVSFYAYPDFRYGTVVGAADIRGDSNDEILTLPGPDPSNAAVLRVWSLEGGDPYEVNLYNDFDAFDLWMTHGGRLAGSENGWE